MHINNIPLKHWNYLREMVSIILSQTGIAKAIDIPDLQVFWHNEVLTNFLPGVDKRPDFSPNFIHR